jgi:hypothetical protein
MLKKLTFLTAGILIAAAALFAANVWEKPYPTWTEEERKKIAEDSPWGDRRNRGTGEQNQQGSVSASIWMMWESALPIKHMLMAKDADKDPAVKARMEREEPYHVLHVQGLPASLRDLVGEKEKVIATTVIKVKGKPDIHPTDIVQPAAAAPKGGFGGFAGKGGAGKGGAAKGGAPAAPAGGDEGFGSLDAGGGAPAGGAPGGGGGGMGRGGMGGMGGGFGSIQLYIVFAKDAPITLEDKEFEFFTKIGKMEIRQKYKLKDMMYNGKLEW